MAGACGAHASGSPRAGEPTPATRAGTARYTPTSGDVNGQALPIFAYLPPPTDTLSQASNILVTLCMATYGFTSNVPQIPPGQQVAPMYRRYGVTSLAVADAYGYHLESGSPLRTGHASPTPTMSPAEHLVYFGTPSGTPLRPPGTGTSPDASGAATAGAPAGGCVGWASRQLYGTQVDFSLPRSIETQDFFASEADATVQSTFRAWRACMASHGFHYQTPLDAAGAFKGGSDKPPSALEIVTATADVRCKGKTGLVTTWFDVESRLEERDIQHNIVTLSAIRNAMLAAERKAVTVIANGAHG